MNFNWFLPVFFSLPPDVPKVRSINHFKNPLFLIFAKPNSKKPCNSILSLFQREIFSDALECGALDRNIKMNGLIHGFSIFQCKKIDKFYSDEELQF